MPVAASWFALTDLGDGVLRIHEPHVHELIQANVFLVKGQARDLLVDTGCGIASLRDFLERNGALDKRVVAVATHAHYDHVGSLGEFEERLIHPGEAEDLASGADEGTLRSSGFPESFRKLCERLGMPLPELLITASPHEGYDPDAYRLEGIEPTGLIREGDAVDLGDRVFEVLHLPGHSPGGIGLLDRRAGTLFSGDAVYDGPLLDEEIPGADVAQYVKTMRRLRELSVSVVHPGHNLSFARDRLVELTSEYIERRDGSG